VREIDRPETTGTERGPAGGFSNVGGSLGSMIAEQLVAWTLWLGLSGFRSIPAT